MPRRVPKTRQLWINIKVKFLRGPRPSPQVVRDTLIEAVIRGDYVYPKNWLVRLEWSNSPFGDMKHGEFGDEMRASARSSVGFDRAVLKYLRSQP